MITLQVNVTGFILKRNINIKEVAVRAGVSIATVSRVLNNTNLVKEDTRKHILRVVEDLNYKPSQIARSLSKRKTDTIGLILPDLVGEFFMDVTHNIDAEAYKAKRFTMVSSSHKQRDMLRTLEEFLNSGRVDGLIMMVPQVEDDMKNFIRKSDKPVVFLNPIPDSDEFVTFSINNYQGAFASVEHLISHGYKNIGMIKGPNENCEAEDRFLGYQDALIKNKIPYNPDFVVEGDFSSRSGYYGLMRLLSQSVKPDAIFAANDMTALGIYEAARDSNIKIPQDLAVVGFDDIFLTKLISPRLTTVHVPISELSSKAVQYLIKMIEKEVDPKAPYNEVISTGLVFGGSCGCKVDAKTSVI